MTGVGAAVLLVVLLLGGLAGADVFSRDRMAAIGERVARQALQVPPSTPVEVQVGGGSAILQLLLGKVDHVTVDANELQFDALTGDLHVELFGLPTNEVTPVSRTIAYMSFDRADALALAQTVYGDDVSAIQLRPPFVEIAMGTRTHGATHAWVLTTPYVDSGRLQLRAVGVRAGGVRLSMAQAAEEFDFGADDISEGQGPCLHTHLPGALATNGVRVAPSNLVIPLDARQVSMLDVVAPHTACQS